jgi:hypothetical protein
MHPNKIFFLPNKILVKIASPQNTYLKIIKIASLQNTFLKAIKIASQQNTF